MLVLPDGTFVSAGQDAEIGRDGLPLYVPGEVILKLKPQEKTPAAALQRIAQAHALRDSTPLFAGPGQDSLSRIHRARIRAGQSVLEQCRRLRVDPAIEWAEPNYIYRTSATPNDPEFGQQWHLHNTGQSGGLFDADIDAPEAWDITTGSSSVAIAIVDTGVKYDHADLAANICTNPGETGGGKETDGIDNDANGYIDDFRGWDFVSVASTEVAAGEDPGPPDNDPQDVSGHGTHTAGIAAAVGNNATGVSGVAWQCRIMPVRAGFKAPSGQGLLLSTDAAAGIVYAADRGAKVISMSWGGGDSSAIRDAISHARTKDVCLVAAAGNAYGYAPTYPAAYPDVLSIAASDGYDTKAAFSNYGYWVDLIAPGVAIRSTWVDGGYIDLSGTSMACPVVSGIAGLVRSRFPTRNADATATTIISGADRFASSLYVGAGRANAFKALQLDQACTATITSPEPGAIVEGVINLVGSANGSFFASYTLAYATTIGSSSFTTFRTSDTPVMNGVLGSLDTTFPDGPLLLRLAVTSTGGDVFVAQVLVEIARSAWFHAGGQIVSSPKPVKLAAGGTGIAFGTSQGKVYLLSPTGQAMPGWPVITGNFVGYTTPAVADLNGDGVEDIVIHSNGSIAAYAQDGSVLPGWPQSLFLSVGGNSVCGAPTVYDLDNDGDLEVIVGHLFYFWAFHHNGAGVAGWPIYHSFAFAPIFSTPAVGDLDHDGDAEVCLKMYGGNGQPADVYLVHHDTASLAGWPKVGLDRSHYPSPILADLDGDGNLDVLVSLHYYTNANYIRVHAWRVDGSLLPGFPTVGTWNTVPINNAIGDIDGDGFLEIFVGTNNPTPPYYAVHAWSHDGTPLAGQWPRSASSCANGSSPVIADLDGGRNEILMGVGGCYTNDTGGLNAWSFDGAPLSDWPKAISAPVGDSSPLVIDADGDQRPEVYIGSQHGWIYRYIGNPAQHHDFAQWNQAHHDRRNTNSPKCRVDFDEDGDVDSEDAALLRACSSRSMVPASSACISFDLDDDTDVDPDDQGTFQRCFSGANRSAKPACAK